MGATLAIKQEGGRWPGCIPMDVTTLLWPGHSAFPMKWPGFPHSPPPQHYFPVGVATILVEELGDQVTTVTLL